MIPPNAIKQIACIKPRGIGDVVLATIIFDSLLAQFPEAAIDFITEAPSAPVLRPLPFLREVIVWKKGSILSTLRFFRLIRKKKYDLILDFFSNPKTAQLTFFSGAPYRAGFPYRGRTYAYNLFGPVERDTYHAAELHLEFLRKIGIEPISPRLHVGLTAEDTAFAQKALSFFSKGKPIIAISPSGGWESKKCDPEKLAEFADAIAESFNAEILIVWGPGDELDARTILSSMKHAAVLAPPSTIREMTALMQACTAVVANDSGPMHLAAAAGVPVLGLFGPTNPKLQGPYSKNNMWIRKDELDCIACNHLVCPRNHECFKLLETERVVIAVRELLIKNNRLPV